MTGWSVDFAHAHDGQRLPAADERGREARELPALHRCRTGSEFVFVNPKTTRRYKHGTEQAKCKAVEAARINIGQACPKSAPNEERRPLLTAVNS